MSRLQDGHAVEMTPPPQEPKQPEGATHPSPPSSPSPHHSPEPQKVRLLGWEGNERDTLLVVATLITALTYQLGTNIPGGYWQDDKDGKDGHRAGDPIMRDRHRHRYWLFMAASWVGFGSSMLLTLSLLTGVAVKSRQVRWPFVLAYSSLMLTFITSQPRTSLAMDLALWAGLLIFLSAVVSFRRVETYLLHRKLHVEAAAERAPVP